MLASSHGFMFELEAATYSSNLSAPGCMGVDVDMT